MTWRVDNACAIIWDARVRTNGYSLGTDDRTRGDPAPARMAGVTIVAIGSIDGGLAIDYVPRKCKRAMRPLWLHTTKVQ
jgi:hypothetical protein